MKRSTLLPTILGIILIVAGIVTIFSPLTASTIVPYIIGISLAAAGIGKILRYRAEKRYYGQSRWSLAGAVVSLVFGFILASSHSLQLKMGASVIRQIGCFVMIMGVIRIVHAFRLRSATSYTDMFGRPVSSRWYAALIPGLVMTVFGLINVCNPMLGLGALGTLTGIILIAAGSSLLSFESISWYW